MASLKDKPVAEARDFVRSLIDRCRMKDGEIPSESWVVLEVEAARNIWWLMKWLEIIAEGPTQFTLFSASDCLRRAAELVEEIKLQDGDERTLVLSRADLSMLIDAECHLDQHSILKAMDASRGSQNRRKYGAKRR